MIDDCLINNDTLTKCYHCNNDLKEKKWKSEWNPGHHYKKTTCDCCGKEVWVTVDFDGSGHDNWKPNKNKIKEPELKNSPRPV